MFRTIGRTIKINPYPMDPDNFITNEHVREYLARKKAIFEEYLQKPFQQKRPKQPRKEKITPKSGKLKRLLRAYPSFRVIEGLIVIKNSFFHHRKPSSALGGNDCRNLTSQVDPYRHTLFHCFAGNLHPAQFTTRLERILRYLFGKDLPITLECQTLDGNPVPSHSFYAYKNVEGASMNKYCNLYLGVGTLPERLTYFKAFKAKMSIRQLIHDLNEHWIDPDYKIVAYVETSKNPGIV